ncbi:MAG TPA: toll/interleukin-1 receptor domain-containing protein [Candidatus Binatia bacterium]
MGGIFISYRREDSAAYAGRLYDRLSAHFGADQVFMDVDDIPPGADFAKHIDLKVGSCDAMIVIIGEDWLTARNDKGQLHLSDPDDFVGVEVALALQRGVLVIPALVGGAQMPKAEELRADLRPLARRNALILNDRDFQSGTDNLVKTIEKIPAIRQRVDGAAGDPRTERRQQLLRRLVWKVPIIFLLISFALWWEWDEEKEESIKVEAAAAALSGSWSGDVTYSWGAKYTEPFFFQPEGNKLFGSAGFLGAKRGIEEGRIEGENISFFVRFQEVSGDESRERKNYYWGKLNGKEILVRMQDDRGNPPVEWVLRKSHSP